MCDVLRILEIFPQETKNETNQFLLLYLENFIRRLENSYLKIYTRNI